MKVMMVTAASHSLSWKGPVVVQVFLLNQFSESLRERASACRYMLTVRKEGTYSRYKEATSFFRG